MTLDKALPRLLAALAPVALIAILLAGPAAAGTPECGNTPAGQGLGDCVLVIGDDAATTATGADTLPRTGEDSLPLVQIGVVLLGLGGLAVLVARKRADSGA